MQKLAKKMQKCAKLWENAQNCAKKRVKIQKISTAGKN